MKSSEFQACKSKNSWFNLSEYRHLKPFRSDNFEGQKLANKKAGDLLVLSVRTLEEPAKCPGGEAYVSVSGVSRYDPFPRASVWHVCPVLLCVTHVQCVFVWRGERQQIARPISEFCVEYKVVTKFSAQRLFNKF